MNRDNLKAMTSAALGHTKAELVFKNAKVVNVFTEEILSCDVAVERGVIVGVGRYDGETEADLCGKYLCPGFIDAHLHFESTLVAPPELVTAALEKGTTTFIADPHEAANVAGEGGIDYILEQTEGLSANIYMMLPSCVPATASEENGCVFTAERMQRYLAHPRVLGLGEVMDYASVVSAEPEMVKKLRLFEGRVRDGHAPDLTAPQLSAYALVGICTDHESTSYEYAKQEVRNGLTVLIREGSGARNLDAIVTGLVRDGAQVQSYAFCTDDKHIDDIRREGHISHNIRRSIELGIPPARAIRMATLNAARCYGLTHLGAIAPGCQADLVVLDDLDTVSVHSVYHKGRRVEFDGGVRVPRCPERLLHTVCMAPVAEKDLQLAAGEAAQPVITVTAGQLTTGRRMEKLPAQNGVFTPDERFAKLVVAERHHATGHVGVAAVMGFCLHGGAIASSVSHDSHNLIAVGDSDQSILLALHELERVQGGYTVVRNGRVAGTLPLPVMGLMSDAGYESVERTLAQLLRAAHELGVPQKLHPFITLSFLALPVIPRLRLTTRGLYDVGSQRFI